MREPMNPEKSLHLIKCECGTEILVIPDSVEMGRVIEAHAINHGKKQRRNF